ncbi:MAG: D-sedoheptulose 7-phosphate isomerase [Cytophagales bacterium]|nr:D-sedoheptulose 7-phosphate isomerase [Cytophagales bacterium]
MEFDKLIYQELEQAQKVLNDFMSDKANLNKIEKAADLLVASFEQGGKVLSCGNGGSSCDAAHFAEELTGRFREDRKALPAIAMNEVGHLTCVSNDYGYDSVFSRYLQALGTKGDVLLAISTSGNSKNVLKAVEYAKQKGIKVIALTGKNGGTLSEYADIELRVPHRGYADRIQEVHIKIIHILILLIEQKISQ